MTTERDIIKFEASEPLTVGELRQLIAVKFDIPIEAIKLMSPNHYTFFDGTSLETVRSDYHSK